MSDPTFGLALLLAALPTGLALTSRLLPARSLIARAGTATLAGLGAIAGVAHALLCLGVPARIAVPIVAAAGTAAGALFLARRRAAPEPGLDPPPRAAARVLLEGGPLILVAALLLLPFSLAREYGIVEHDAVRIWAPKAVRAWNEAPPVLDDATQAHPEYPRGLGIVTAAVAAPLGSLDARTPRFVGLATFALLLLAVFDALSARRNPLGAALAVVILGSLPTLLRQAATGQADVPLSAFVLLAGIGLAPQRQGRPAILVALAGALGALVTKDEGLVFCAAAALVLAAKLARRRRFLAAFAVVTLPVALALPWVILRAQAPGGDTLILGSWSQNAGLVLLRFDLAIRQIAHYAFGLPDPSPGSFTLTDVAPGVDLAVWTAAACGLVLLVGRGGRFPILPLGILYLTELAVMVVTPVGVEWQVVTAYGRLVLHGLPLLVLSAADKLTAPDALDVLAGGEAPAAAAA